MDKKKLFCVVAALALMTCLIAGCGSSNDAVKQTASANQSVGDGEVAVMTVDLTDGCSVEFASGAAYFYKGEANEENLAAHAFVVTKKEYDEEVAYLAGSADYKDKFKDLGNGIYSCADESSCEYFFPAEDGFYIKVVVQESALGDADSIYQRFSARSAE